jgi:hypothetical protein
MPSQKAAPKTRESPKYSLFDTKQLQLRPNRGHYSHLSSQQEGANGHLYVDAKIYGSVNVVASEAHSQYTAKGYGSKNDAFAAVFVINRWRKKDNMQRRKFMGQEIGLGSLQK